MQRQPLYYVSIPRSVYDQIEKLVKEHAPTLPEGLDDLIVDFVEKRVKTAFSRKEVLETYLQTPDLWGRITKVETDNGRIQIRITNSLKTFLKNSYRVIMETKIEKLLRDEKFLRENKYLVSSFRQHVNDETKPASKKLEDIIRSIEKPEHAFGVFESNEQSEEMF